MATLGLVVLYIAFLYWLDKWFKKQSKKGPMRGPKRGKYREDA